MLFQSSSRVWWILLACYLLALHLHMLDKNCLSEICYVSATQSDHLQQENTSLTASSSANGNHYQDSHNLEVSNSESSQSFPTQSSTLPLSAQQYPSRLLNATPGPSPQPTISPTSVPSKLPSYSPSAMPSNNPTENPIIIPTTDPTATPTHHPSLNPTSQPSQIPTSDPTIHPTNAPTPSPTIFPTNTPSQLPTQNPTFNPSTFSPSVAPTEMPTLSPKHTSIPQLPTHSPSLAPSKSPSKMPTMSPMVGPSKSPLPWPTKVPTLKPTIKPTESPIKTPTRSPTNGPSKKPSKAPTTNPTKTPTKTPTLNPSQVPTTLSPTATPSTRNPTLHPTLKPTRAPKTPKPTATPTTRSPTLKPSINPTNKPTKPTSKPTGSPFTPSPTNFPTTKSPTKSPLKLPPNIIMIVLDDVGYGDIRANGNPMVYTPFLDQVKTAWTSLENFHMDPTCSPSRAALLTGRYPVRVGVWNTVMARNILRSGEVTLANVLKSNGYYTALVGKWHLGDSYPYRAIDRGFDYYFGLKGGGGINQTPDFWRNNNFNTKFVKGTGEVISSVGFCSDVLTDEAMRVITNAPKPFFLYLPYNAAHVPNSAPLEDTKLYLKKVAKFYGMVTNLDRNLQRLDAYIDLIGLKENTIMILTSDNGTGCGPGKCTTNSGGMSGYKSSVLDGGHRVFFYMRYPKKNIQGKVYNQLLAHIDVFPTLIELTGIDYTPENGNRFDGTSFAKLLLGQKMPALDSRMIVIDDQKRLLPQRWGNPAVLYGSWRLVGQYSLYDVSTDSRQWSNIINSNSNLANQMRLFYEDYFDDISVGMEKLERYIIGSDVSPVVYLNGMDLVTQGNMPPWDQIMITKGTGAPGYWALYAEQDATYVIEARRFPLESLLKINKSLKFTRAELYISSSLVATRTVSSTATVLVFGNIFIPKGQVDLEVRLYTKSGKIQNACYVTMRKV